MRAEASETLPADAAALFEPAEFQLGAAWFDAIAEAALPAGARPLWLVARAAGRARGALPLLRTADGGMAGLTAPYTSVFRPLGAADADWHAVGRAFARVCRGAGTLRLEALDPDWPPLSPLLAGFRGGGMVPLRFANFGNWHIDVSGQSWRDYLAARPGALRSTIRRRLARAEADRAVTFTLVSGGAALVAGIAAYDSVYARSWKEPEPYPRFAATLMRAAAGAGALRLGLLHAGGEPVAAQLWLLAGGVATVHKLAHDEAARALSPGTVLTAMMIRHLLDVERARTLDFGRGDDPYKEGWTGRRRARIGVLLCPPWRPAGAAAIARHAGGRLVARFARMTPRAGG